MKTSRPVLLSLLFTAAAATTVAPAAFAETLGTRFVLLSGRPASGGGTADRGVLVIPGVVMPLGEGRPASSVAAEADDVAALAHKLKSTLGLEAIEVLYAHPQRLTVDRAVALPPPSATSGVRIEVVLQGFNEELATYRVRFVDGRATFADSLVSVPRSKRALVGGLDGDEAPYLFLVVEPEGTARRVDETIKPPEVLEREAPQYTQEAREAKVQGVVILQLTIDTQGQVRDVEVLKGLPLGLSESATETVRRWRFKPALDADGRPVSVLYNITIQYRLDHDGKLPPQEGPDL